LKDAPVPIDRRERSFFGKVLDLIDKNAAEAKPRQAPDLVRDLVAVLAKLIEQAPEDRREGLRAMLARNVAFISNLMESGVEFHAVELSAGESADDSHSGRCCRTRG
jgi:hypothetical protein